MANNNYDYIAMLNMDLSPPAASESDFQNDLDLWLNTDFSFDPLDSAAFSTDRKVDDESDHRREKETTKKTTVEIQPTVQEQIVQQTPSPAETVFTRESASVAQQNFVPIAPQPTPFLVPGVSFPPLPGTADASAPLTLEQIIAAAAAIGANAGGLQTGLPQTVTSVPPPTVPVAPAMIPTPAAQTSASFSNPNHANKTEEELDKRRRNTAASARFRAKKKMREQALEQTAKQLTEKADKLERRVKEYEMELKWLRQLVTDRDGKKRLRDFYEESGLTFVEGTMAAGCAAAVASKPAASAVPVANLAAAAAAFAGVMALAGQPISLPLPPADNSNKRPRVA